MSVAALEARARGTHQVLSPVLDLARDPRWGRTEETYGEDPYLVARLGVAAIRGYQGTSRWLARDKVLATAKHFAGHGPHEGGINTAPTATSRSASLRDEYLSPFEAAITETPVMAVMPSYNEMDGVPSHKNRWLLDRVLRQEWGFDGMVRLRLLRDRADGVPARRGRRPGRRGAPGPRGGRGHRAAGHRGLPEARRPREVGAASRRRARPRGRAHAAREVPGRASSRTRTSTPTARRSVSNTPEHQALALEAARRAIVLLKNDGRPAAPRPRSVRTIAVIGPNAKGVRLGGYSSMPGRGVDILDGITQKAGPGVRVLLRRGRRASPSTRANWSEDKVVFGDPGEEPPAHRGGGRRRRARRTWWWS